MYIKSFIDIPIDRERLVDYPIDSGKRIYPIRLFYMLLDFMITIDRLEDAININIDTPSLKEYIDYLSLDYELNKDELDSITVIAEEFLGTINLIYSKTLYEFFNFNEYNCNTLRLSYVLRDCMLQLETDMLREYGFGIKGWLHIHYGYLCLGNHTHQYRVEIDVI